MLPVIGLRLVEGRCGSTLLMQLLATDERVVFDRRYPSEYRFLSYFARMAGRMTEPFDEARHPGVTPFFFGPEPVWGPVPFASEVVDPAELEGPLLGAMWQAWSERCVATNPGAAAYAEKLAVEASLPAAAGIPLRVIDLVRDPRDMLASIRSFTAGGMDGFGREPGVDEQSYLHRFVQTYAAGVQMIRAPLPDGVERIVVRYEDLVGGLYDEAERIGSWAGVELQPDAIDTTGASYERHRTSASAAESVGRWRVDLTAAEAQVIAEELSEVAGLVGYDLADGSPA